jgi:hypothetical protein
MTLGVAVADYPNKRMACSFGKEDEKQANYITMMEKIELITLNYICMLMYLYEAASEKAIHSPGMRIQSFGNHMRVHHYTPEEWMPTYKCRLCLDSNRKKLMLPCR